LKNPHSKLYDLADPTDANAVLDEVQRIAKSLGLSGAAKTIRIVHAEVESLFLGKSPHYRASNTSYHDLEHTLSVVLATGRLLHGCALLGKYCPQHPFLLGILAAYFHDTGLIQDKNDTQGTGAKHTVGHEMRSVAVMRTLLTPHGLTEQDMRDAQDMILCTELARDPSTIPFRTPETAQVGLILGTADLMAQIADRSYLEKLPRLFQEFEEAGLPGFSSEMDLLRNTISFYEHVAMTRLEGPLGGKTHYMIHHFRDRYGIDSDLYAEAIERNMKHLQQGLATCGDSYECLMGLLKRSSSRNSNVA